LTHEHRVYAMIYPLTVIELFVYVGSDAYTTSKCRFFPIDLCQASGIKIRKINGATNDLIYCVSDLSQNTNIQHIEKLRKT
jgi:hypothetical protein